MRTVNSFIGSPIERLEDLRFLRGRGEYVDDLVRPGMLHAAILRSAVAHGRIRSIDVARAMTLPGVHSVITAADLGVPVPQVPMRLQPLPEFAPFAQPVIAHDKVRYVGEALAVVLAESAALAEDALEAIDVDIEALPAVADRHASAQDRSLLFEETGSNLALKFHAVMGDAAAACRLALEAPAKGSASYIIAAADTVMNRPSASLLAEVFPGVALTSDVGEFGTLLAIDRARAALGFTPQHSWRDQLGAAPG